MGIHVWSAHRLEVRFLLLSLRNQMLLHNLLKYIPRILPMWSLLNTGRSVGWLLHLHHWWRIQVHKALHHFWWIYRYLRVRSVILYTGMRSLPDILQMHLLLLLPVLLLPGNLWSLQIFLHPSSSQNQVSSVLRQLLRCSQYPLYEELRYRSDRLVHIPEQQLCCWILRFLLSLLSLPHGSILHKARSGFWISDPDHLH